MSTQDALPRWLRTSYIAISEWPRTNSITLTGIGMFIATGVFLAVASMRAAEISEGLLVIHYSAVLAVMGIGNWAESIKRRLPYPTPPAPVDAENVAATTGTPAPTLTKGDAQLAADVLEARQREIAAAGAEAVG